MRTSLVRIAVVVAGLTLLAACGSDGKSDAGPATSVTSAESPARLLPPAEYRAYLAEHPDTPVVNVHVPYEGHIEGTDAFVPYTEIAQWSDLPTDTQAPIALYCRSGRMSAEASATLGALGYTNIVDLDGGMVAWEAADYPLLHDQPAS